MIRFQRVGLRYGKGSEVLTDVSFHIEKGSFHFVTGPSGAGKTSLMQLIGLALRPSRGIIEIFGENVSRTQRHRLPALRRRMGIVFQDFRLLDHLTVRDNVSLPLRLDGRLQVDAARQVDELLRWVGLGDRISDHPARLSGGEQQRVAVARAVVHRPELLLADEPTGNLDDAVAMRLFRLFKELNRMGTTVVVATHNQGIISRMNEPVVELNNGMLSGPARYQAPVKGNSKPNVRGHGKTG
ncbi:MAG: cell division ATP-binding protein FtsE [Pseudomonadota bacterium]